MKDDSTHIWVSSLVALCLASGVIAWIASERSLHRSSLDAGIEITPIEDELDDEFDTWLAETAVSPLPSEPQADPPVDPVD